jgi:hypothetical protein
MACRTFGACEIAEYRVRAIVLQLEGGAMLRKHALFLAILVLLTTLGVASPGGSRQVRPHQTCTIGSELAPSCGAYWGAHSSSGWQAFQSLIGRKLAIVHDYYAWTQVFPSPAEAAAANQGSLLFMDWSLHGQGVTWSQIASGAQNAQINTEAAALKAFGRPIMVSFQHEMDRPVDAVYGTAADYVAAWRHIHSLFAADGVHNVIWVWDPTGYTVHPLASFYPGDAYVTWIMWDPYNWYRCRGGNTPWESFSYVVSGMYNWLTSNSGKPGNGDYLSKPWGLGEYGTVEGPTSTAKAQWFEGAVSALQTSFPRLKALVYFNSNDYTSGRTCTWSVNSSTPSLQGYQAAGSKSSVDLMP